MQQFRAAARGILRGAAAEIPELTAALPRVLTTVGESSRRGLLGSFAQERWELAGQISLHQIFLSGAHLSDDVEEIADTLVHELAHLLAAVRGIKDTSNRGRYHSKRFKACAEELGLRVEYRQPHGFCTVGLSPGLRRRLSSELEDLEAALVLRLRGTASGVRPIAPEVRQPDVSEPTKKYVTAICGCPKVFRQALGYWVPDSTRCEICGEYYVEKLSHTSAGDGSPAESESKSSRGGTSEILFVTAGRPLLSITTTSKEIE